MKAIRSLLLFTALSISIIGCKKEEKALTKNHGEFTISGTKYSGNCTSITDVGDGGSLGNIDVIITGDNGNNSYIVYNMPKSSSGTYSLVDGYYNAGTAKIYSIATKGIGNVYGSKSGTITKTGSNSFEFSSICYDITSGSTYNIIGSGTY